MIRLLLSEEGQVDSNYCCCVRYNSDRGDQYPVTSILKDSMNGFDASLVNTTEMPISKGMSRHSRDEVENK